MCKHELSWRFTNGLDGIDIIHGVDKYLGIDGPTSIGGPPGIGGSSGICGPPFISGTHDIGRPLATVGYLDAAGVLPASVPLHRTEIDLLVSQAEIYHCYPRSHSRSET